MKISSLFILVVFCYWLVACGSDAFYPDEILIEEGLEQASQSETLKPEFPQKYVYEGVAFNPSEYYLIGENSMEQIFPTTELFSQIDSFLLADYFGEDGINYPFREIELLSDSLARVKIVNLETGEEGFVEYPYELLDSKIRLYFSSDPDDFFTLIYNEQNQQLLACLQSHIFIHENRAFGGLEIDDCTSSNKNEIINQLVDKEMDRGDLQMSDTLVLNISNIVLEFEE